MGVKGQIRPMPESFVAVAWSIGARRLAAQFKASQNTIRRWRQELSDGARSSINSPPADFTEVAPTMSKKMLAEHYGVGIDRINAWLKRAAVSCRLGFTPLQRKVPDDFAEMAATMHQKALVKHYHADVSTVRRWIARTGIQPKAYEAPPTQAPRRKTGHFTVPQAVHRDLRPATRSDFAADTLRRERFVVHRCDERGRYAERGEFWRVGNVVCTPDELLARAAKYERRAA